MSDIINKDGGHMEIENSIFKKAKIDYFELESYGFKKNNHNYTYETFIIDNTMKVFITINNTGDITGKIIDLDTNMEYNNFRLASITGNFASSVKEAYEAVLKDIKDKCFTEESFIYNQSNRISKMIYDKYGVSPEFLWEDYPNFGIFRNKRSNKWFALIMDIEKNKLIKKSSGTIECLNIKLDDEVTKYINTKGIYPAYHMSKSKWVTIYLDDTLTDDYIMSLIDKSYNLNNISGIWVVPANPKYYDIVNAFKEKDELLWKQSNNILKDDIVYIYVASPYSCIMYKCLVLESSIPYEYKSKDVSMSYVMKLKLLKRYSPDEYPIDKLSKYGLKSIRGPRSIPKELLDILENE